jgi:hypothetical protein
MGWARWIIVLLGLVTGGYMLFDGARALIIGDYITPSSGEHAGQLGPWSKVVAAIGIEPRSTAMKVAFMVFGTTWLTLVLAFLFKADWSWLGLLLVACATLWYLPVGTIAAVLVAALLFVPSVKEM